MEVADQIAVMNKGGSSRSARPRDLYEHPANEFVMSFVGQASTASATPSCGRTISSSLLEPSDGDATRR